MPFEKGKSYYRLKEIVWKNDENGCWICTSHSYGTGGYPTHKVNHKSKRISHTIYERYRGEIPQGMIVCHKCDNPNCINPDHLFIGTQADNMKDMCGKGRKFLTNGELNGCAKLTEDKVNEIRKIREVQQLSYQKIADMFNISCSNVGFIITGKRWKYLLQDGVKNEL